MEKWQAYHPVGSAGARDRSRDRNRDRDRDRHADDDADELNITEGVFLCV